MARTVTGIDIGSRTNKFVRGFYKGNTFHITNFAVVQHPEGSIGEAWSAGAAPFRIGESRIGLTGRDVNIRYVRAPRVPDWQLRKLMRFEVDEVGGQSGSEVASDFNVLPALPEIEGEDVVLLALARESLLEDHVAGLSSLGGTPDAFSPCALALYNAWTRYGVVEEETVLLANIGHENLDVILVRGADLLFARNLTGGAKLFDAAIAERFNISPQKAEQLKIELATLEPGARYKDANQEKASRAALGAGGQLLSLLQSTVMFCKSQVKVTNLRVDKVLLCGGGAALQGLPRYLSQGLGVPVELFDPFRVVDTAGLAADAAEQLEEYKLESVVALGLATMASDPDAYSIEILPAKVRAKREFFGGTIFAIVAAVLAVAFLGWVAWRTKDQLGTAKSEAASLDSKLRRSKETDRKTRDVLKSSGELVKAAQQLEGVAGSGEQVARALEQIERNLPEGFWIESFQSDWLSNEQLRVTRAEPRPTVRITGRAREGTESIAGLLETYVDNLRKRLPQAELVYAPGASGDKFTLDFTLFAPPKEQPPPEANAAAKNEAKDK
jgi:type IV pilus assembly protein PilM